MKSESLRIIFQQKNIGLLTKRIINSVNKPYKNKLKLNSIKTYRLSTIFVDKPLKIVDKLKPMLISISFEEKLL